MASMLWKRSKLSSLFSTHDYIEAYFAPATFSLFYFATSSRLVPVSIASFPASQSSVTFAIDSSMLNVTIPFSFLFSYGFALSRCNSEDTVGGAVSVGLKIDVFHSDNAFSKHSSICYDSTVGVEVPRGHGLMFSLKPKS